jgi:hypothetical protein
MKTVIAILIAATLCSADYFVDVSGYTRVTYVNSHSFILWKGNKALALIKVKYCIVMKDSEVLVYQNQLNDYDDVLVDGIKCQAMVTKL